MELFWLEHKKLWKKSSTKFCVALCFLYSVIFGSIFVYQWFSFGSSKDGTGARNFDGYEQIRKCQSYAEKYGELSDETLQEWVRDYQSLRAAGQEDKMDETDWQVVNSNLIRTLYPELEEADKLYVMIECCYVDPDRLTDVYGRRAKAIERFLDMNNQSGAEREYLLGINEKVSEPFSWKWVYGWSVVLGSSVGELGIVIALFLSIVLSTMFAGEWHTNTSPMLLTTKNG